MDWIEIFIGFGMVWTGAVLFGFPVGYAVGRRAVWNEIEKDFVIIDSDENGFQTVPATQKRCNNFDVLDAKFIEEVKRWD